MIHGGKEKLFEFINYLSLSLEKKLRIRKSVFLNWAFTLNRSIEVSCRSSITCNAEKGVSIFVTIRLTGNVLETLVVQNFNCYTFFHPQFNKDFSLPLIYSEMFVLVFSK